MLTANHSLLLPLLPVLLCCTGCTAGTSQGKLLQAGFVLVLRIFCSRRNLLEFLRRCCLFLSTSQKWRPPQIQFFALPDNSNCVYLQSETNLHYYVYVPGRIAVLPVEVISQRYQLQFILYGHLFRLPSVTQSADCVHPKKRRRTKKRTYMTSKKTATSQIPIVHNIYIHTYMMMVQW